MNEKEFNQRIAYLKHRFPDADNAWLMGHVEDPQFFGGAIPDIKPDATLQARSAPERPAPKTLKEYAKDILFPSTEEAFRRLAAGAHGVTLGLSDISTGLGAATAAALSGKPVGAAYRAGRNWSQSSAAEHPFLSLLAGLPRGALGNRLGTAAMERLGPVGAGGASLGRELAGGVVSGAAVGGAYGLTQGDSPFSSGLKGAAFGGGLGAGTAGVLAGGRGLARWLGLRSNMMGDEQASRALQEAAKRRGQTPDEMVAELRTRSDLPGSIMDANPQLQRLSKDVATQSPKAGQQLDAFARQRASEIPEDVLGEASAAIGEPTTNFATLRDDMENVLRQRDDLRFGQLDKRFPKAIRDPGVLAQWNAIVDELPNELKSLWSQQNIAMEPRSAIAVNVRSGPYKGGTAPTLRGVFELRKALRTRLQSYRDAQAARQLSGDDATTMGQIQKALDRMDNLAVDNVPGGAELRQAITESANDRTAIDALLSGRRAMADAVEGAPGVPQSPEDVSREMADLATHTPPRSYPDTPDLPDARRAYRLGVSALVPALRGRNPVPENPNIVNALRGTTASGIIEAVAPKKDLARQLQRRLQEGYAPMVETNKIQTGGATAEAPILQTPTQRLAGQFGQSAFLGTGSTRGLGMMIGSAAGKALTGRQNVGTRKAADKLGGILTGALSDPASADAVQRASDYLRLIGKERLLRQSRSIGRTTPALLNLMGLGREP